VSLIVPAHFSPRAPPGPAYLCIASVSASAVTTLAISQGSEAAPRTVHCAYRPVRNHRSVPVPRETLPKSSSNPNSLQQGQRQGQRTISRHRRHNNARPIEAIKHLGERGTLCLQRRQARAPCTHQGANPLCCRPPVTVRNALTGSCCEDRRASPRETTLLALSGLFSFRSRRYPLLADADKAKKDLRPSFSHHRPN
jgi:hypothetical protein